MQRKRGFKIIQVNRSLWQIVNYKGDVIVDDLMLESAYRAEQYIKNYVSSYHNYRYEVIPLTKESKCATKKKARKQSKK